MRAFEPGQYIAIGRVLGGGNGAGRLVQRTYSIGSSAKKRDSVELFIVRVDDGAFTSWLMEEGEGARVWLAPRAKGRFTLESFERGKDLVLVATGTGIAPYLSMYRTYRDDPPWRRIVIINGVRYAADLGYRRELEAEAAKRRDLVYLPTVTREAEDSGWKGLRGRVDAVLAPETYARLSGAPLDPDQCHVYLCGNPDMIDGTEAALAARGFRTHTARRPGNLHVEKYW